MSNAANDIPQKIGWRKLAIPVAIGIGVSVYLIATNFNPAALATVHVTQKLVLGLFLAALAIIVRDFAFMYKIRLSTGEKLSWLKTLQVIIMWEFGAAVTPKLGEVAFTLFVLKKSGLSYGRSTAAIMLNTFLDNLAFVVVFGLLYLGMGERLLLVSGDCPDLAGHKIMQGLRGFANHAWIGYAAICAAALFFGSALFLIPGATRNFFYWLASFSIFTRIKGGLQFLGDEIVLTANEYKNHGYWFWTRMTVATFINWSARYLLVNALIFAFATEPVNMLDVYARQYVLWIYLIIPTTPGSSGVAELSFIALNCEFMPVGLSAAIALIWRMYSYYLYLLLGMLVLPYWTKGAAESQ